MRRVPRVQSCPPANDISKEVTTLTASILVAQSLQQALDGFSRRVRRRAETATTTALSRTARPLAAHNRNQ